ncbi:MAG: hypothetical protein GXY06_03435, partial [Clostridiaceae bacterium]|nr:hypothetical protein [Clostridiaceae bacterium]
MKRHSQAKRQNLPLILMIVLTVSLAGVALVMIFGGDLLTDRGENTSIPSSSSMLSPSGTISGTPSESSSDPSD